MIQIKTDNKWHDFKDYYDVPKKVLASQFEHIPQGNGQFFVFKRHWYSTQDFMRIWAMGRNATERRSDSHGRQDEPSGPFKDWDGVAIEGHHSGVLVKISPYGSQYKVGTYIEVGDR